MIRFELLKLMRSRRPLMALASLLLFLVLMLAGFWTYARKRLGRDPDFEFTFENESYFNGLTFAIYGFYFAFVLLLPIFAAIEGGVQLAGERHQRTLHLLLARPVSRGRIFLSKAGVSALYVLVGTGAFLALTLGIGLLLVGWGELRLYPGVLQMVQERQFLPQDEALLRFALAWPAASLALFVPLSLAMLIAAFARTPVNAVGGAVSAYLVLYIVAEVHFFAELRPFLFTSYSGYWRALFHEQIPWASIARDAAKLAAFALGFQALALYRFRTREEL